MTDVIDPIVENHKAEIDAENETGRGSQTKDISCSAPGDVNGILVDDDSVSKSCAAQVIVEVDPHAPKASHEAENRVEEVADPTEEEGSKREETVKVEEKEVKEEAHDEGDDNIDRGEASEKSYHRNVVEEDGAEDELCRLKR